MPLPDERRRPQRKHNLSNILNAMQLTGQDERRCPALHQSLPI
jgi:hypothetical protein